MEEIVNIYPEDHIIYDGVNLVGRSAGTAGARKDDGQPLCPTSAEGIGKADDQIVGCSWPGGGGSRVNEVTFIQRAEEVGKTNLGEESQLVAFQRYREIPIVTSNTYSTSLIQQYLGLDMNGARVLRVIVFRRLQEVKYLDEEDMLIALLDCFFCKCFCGPYLMPRHLLGGRSLGEAY